MHSNRLENDTKGEIENEILLNTTRSSPLEGKRRILRASDVLLSLAGRSTSSGIAYFHCILRKRRWRTDALTYEIGLENQELSPAVENFQEVLRLFPPFRDDDGTSLGAMEVKCPDCDAVFSSEYAFLSHSDVG
jgi:hypothetical protein